MSKRLQVVMSEPEHRLLTRIARKKGIPLSEWVRTVLREASRSESLVVPARRLEAIRMAARHTFPAPDIDQMLAEIERGYGGA